MDTASDPFTKADPRYRDARRRGANCGAGFTVSPVRADRIMRWVLLGCAVLVVLAVRFL